MASTCYQRANAILVAIAHYNRWVKGSESAGQVCHPPETHDFAISRRSLFLFFLPAFHLLCHLAKECILNSVQEPGCFPCIFVPHVGGHEWDLFKCGVLLGLTNSAVEHVAHVEQ